MCVLGGRMTTGGCTVPTPHPLPLSILRQQPPSREASLDMDLPLFLHHHHNDIPFEISCSDLAAPLLPADDRDIRFSHRTNRTELKPTSLQSPPETVSQPREPEESRACPPPILQLQAHVLHVLSKCVCPQKMVRHGSTPQTNRSLALSFSPPPVGPTAVHQSPRCRGGV